MNERNRENTVRPTFDFGRYSIICGVSGLLMLFFFFPSGMYLGFFMGTVGFVCALIAKRTNGRRCTAGLVLCGCSLVFSLFFYFTLLTFYDALRDPVIGPRFSQMFIQMMEQQNIPVDQFARIMAQ